MPETRTSAKLPLCRQYCEGHFETSRVSTIGVDFQTKVVTLPDGEVKLSIWDMAGQERFESYAPVFTAEPGQLPWFTIWKYPETLEHLQRWYEETRTNCTCQKFRGGW